MIGRSSSYGGVLVGMRLSCALLLFGSPGLVRAAPEVGDIGDETWVDGPEAVQLGLDRGFPDVAVDNRGRRIHVWSEYGLNGSQAGEIFLRRFDAEGNPLEDPKQVSTTVAHQQHARVAMSGDGSFLVIFQSWDPPDLRVVVRSRAYASNGNPLGPEQRVSTVFTNNATGSHADVAALRDSGGGPGGYAVVWQSSNSAGSDTGWAIEGCMVSATGVPGAEFQVNSRNTAGGEDYPSVTELNDGGFLVTWSLYPHLWGRRFNAAGGPIGNDFQISTSAAVARYDNDAAIGWDGTIAVVWSDADPVDTGKEIRARLFDADLDPLGPDFRVNTLTSGAQETPRVADLGPRGFLVVWHSDEASGSDIADSVEARLVTGPNTFDGPQFQLNVWDNNNSQQNPGAHGWYGRLGTTWYSLTWNGSPPPNIQNAPFIIGRDIEECIYCDDIEWFQPNGSGNLWRWSITQGVSP